MPDDPTTYSPDDGTGDVVPPDTLPANPFAAAGTAAVSQRFSVPGDIDDIATQVANHYGVPPTVLETVLWHLTRWRKNQLSVSLMSQVAQKMRQQYEVLSKAQTVGGREPELGAGTFGQTSEGEVIERTETTVAKNLWYTVASALARVPLQTIKNNLASDPEVSSDINFGGGTGRRIIPGLTDDQDAAAHAIADSAYLQYFGRYPNDDEYRNLIQMGLTSTSIIDWLRRQPYAGTTIGKWDDAKKLADKYAQSTFGRDADPGEINWLLNSGIDVNTDNVSAYYEQIKNHTTWGADPQHYRAMRSRIAQIMQSFGINVTDQDISNDLVNQAAAGKWTDDQITAQVKGMQQPGAATGTTIGAFQSVKDMANSTYKKYFGKDITPDLVQQMVGMTPDQVLAFVRAMPSPDNPGVPVGIYTDAKDVAQNTLDKLGLVGMTPSPAEILTFVTGKMDSGAIEQFYRTNPKLIAQQPGLPYGLTREDYFNQRTELTRDYGQFFGNTSDMGALEARQQGSTAAAPGESDWLKEIMKEGMSPGEAKQNFQKHFRNLGRPPTLAEVKQFRSKHDETFRSTSAGPSIGHTAEGPVAAGLGGPPKR